MHIGAHVSPAGGPAKAVERGVEAGARAIQIFNQSPRMWRGRDYTDEEVAAFHEAHKRHRMGPVLIHTVYLLNCASEDKELREKSLASLKLALRDGDALDAYAVVLHAGSAKAGEVGPAIKRAGAVIREALAETDRSPLHLENTAGAGGTLGARSTSSPRSWRRPAATSGSGSAWTRVICMRAASTSAAPTASPRSSTTASRSSAPTDSAPCISTTPR